MFAKCPSSKLQLSEDDMEQGFISRWSLDGTFWFNNKNAILGIVLSNFNGVQWKFLNKGVRTLNSISEDFPKQEVYVALRYGGFFIEEE